MHGRPLALLALGMMPLGLVLGQKPAPVSAPPDFSVLASVQYAHTDIYFHTPAGITPVLAGTKEISPGERLDLLVIVNHCARDAGGRADVSYDLTVRFPNGKTQVVAGNAVASNAKAPPGTLLFPRAVTTFVADAGDPPGDYRFEFAVSDHVAGTAAKKAVVIRLADSSQPLPNPENFNPAAWMAHYYQRPEPRRALSVLDALSNDPAMAHRTNDQLGALLGFFEQLLWDNPWLIPQFKESLLEAEGNEQHVLALVLTRATRSKPNFGDDLPKKVRKVLEKAGREQQPAPSLEPMSGGQLDLYWGRFFASGGYRPISDIVAIVRNYLPYAKSLEDFKKLADKPKAPPPDVVRGAILNAALWSLKSNAREHPLVRNYLLSMSESPDTPADLKAMLIRILG